jgi:hypothetical protein
MKRLSLLLLLSLPALTNIARAADDLPSQAKFDRYEAMLKRSPFAVATATAPAGATPDFAKDLYVANAAHSADGDFVSLASTTDKNLKEYLNNREAVHGYTISNIQWSDRVGETKVTISKDGQFATLTFNEALLSQAIQNPGAPMAQPQGVPNRPVPGRPNVTGPPQMPITRPMPVPQIPTPPPHARPVIRRKVPPQQQQTQAATQPDADDDDSDLDNN